MGAPEIAHLPSGLDRRPEPAAATQLELPLVSVIVICFNHAPFLEKCLTSIVQQTYPRLQVIVVENASTDNSREVVERCCRDLPGNTRGLALEPIYSASNDHELGAMLQGMPAARGPYIAFVDGDDWLLPHCIETHIKAHLVSRVSVGVTSVDMYQSLGDDIVVGTGQRAAAFAMSKRGQQSDFCRMENLAAFDFAATPPQWELKASDLHLAPSSMGHEWHWSPTSGLCFRREVLELLFHPKPTIRDGVDGYLMRGACCITGGILIDRSLAVYRMHGNNLFTKHPALENILQFRREQCADLDMRICEALLNCFTAQMKVLADNLEVVDTYIAAIHSLSRVALNRKAGDFSSFTLRFLVEERVRLVEAFDEDTHRRWLRRFTKIKDYAAQALGRQPKPSRTP